MIISKCNPASTRSENAITSEPLTKALFVTDYTHDVALSNGEVLLVNLLTGRSWRGLSEDVLHGRSYVEENRGFNCADDDLQRFREIDGYDKHGRLSIILIPTYSCNFACSYCYEGRLTNEKASWQTADVEGITRVWESLCNREGTSFEKVDFTLLGGELIQEAVIDQVELLVKALKACGAASFCIITNGYHLQEKAESLAAIGITQVMVTIDGPKVVNDGRRISRDESASPFDRAVGGVNECLRHGVPVSVRVNIDQHNVQHLPALARDFKGRGFFDNALFSSYLYPISHDTRGGQYASEAEIAAQLSLVADRHPEITLFRWDLHGLDFIYRLKSNASIPLKLRYCGATSMQYTLDVNGHVYTCWFGAGDESFSIGEADSRTGSLSVDEFRLERFRNRGPLSMIPCSTCKWSLICGGGCTFKAVKKTGMVESPNCAPFPEIFTMCARHAFEGYYGS